jgi:hypothetical protein
MSAAELSNTPPSPALDRENNTAPRRRDSSGSDDAGFRVAAMLHMKVSRGCQTSVADTAICRSTGACGET